MFITFLQAPLCLHQGRAYKESDTVLVSSPPFLESFPAPHCLQEKVLTPWRVSQPSFLSNLLLYPTPLQNKVSLSVFSPSCPPWYAFCSLSRELPSLQPCSIHLMFLILPDLPKCATYLTSLHLSFLICEMGRGEASSCLKGYCDD